MRHVVKRKRTKEEILGKPPKKNQIKLTACQILSRPLSYQFPLAKLNNYLASLINTPPSYNHWPVDIGIRNDFGSSFTQLALT